MNKGDEDQPAIPLTKDSRVLRRGVGRGARNEGVMEEPIQEEALPEEEFEFDPIESH